MPPLLPGSTTLGTLTPVGRARARYASDGAGGATSGRTVVLLFERLERDIDDAETALRTGEIAAAHEALVHAQDIVAALDLALDHTSWDGAANLSQLYRYVQQRLVAANVAKDPAPLADCRVVIGPLTATWREAWVSIGTAAVPVGS